jgi:hypothetical protein
MTRVATVIALVAAFFWKACICVAVHAQPVTSQDIADVLLPNMSKLFAIYQVKPYESVARQKSLAVCLEWKTWQWVDGRVTSNRYPPNIGVDVPGLVSWNYAGNRPTVVDAKEAALRACRSNTSSRDCDCVTLLENDTTTLLAPPATLDAMTAQKTAEASAPVILSLIEDRIQNSTPVKTGVAIEPNLPTDTTIAPHDCIHDYNCVCRREYRNGIKEVAPADISDILSRLRKILQAPFYDCGDVKSLYPQSARLSGFPVCHYLAVDRSRKPVSGLASPDLVGRMFDEVYYEASVPVDVDYIPADEPFFGLKIIYAKDGQKYYLGTEHQIPDAGFYCWTSTPFHGLTFDLSKCKDERSCGVASLAALRKKVESRLLSPPFSATAVQDGATMPGELRYQRKQRPSEILGGVWWEENSYNLNWWQARSKDPDGFARNEIYRGHEEGGGLLFGRLSSYIAVAVTASGVYRDPGTAQQARYEQLMQDLYNTSVREACEEVSGTMSGGVCVLKGDVR